MDEVLRVLQQTDSRKLAVGAAAASFLYYLRNQSQKDKKEENGDKKEKDKGKLSKGKVNKQFFLQLKRLLSIMIPKINSLEFLLLGCQTTLPFLRTIFNLSIAQLDGELVKNIVERQPKHFFYNLLKWIAIAVPATYVNSLIKYLEHKLTVSYRTRLTKFCYDLYMDNDTFYKVSNLDSRLNNADQSLTQDISKFAHSVSRIYTQITKPVFDVVLMGLQLTVIAKTKTGSGTGFAPSFIAVLVVWLTAKLFKMLTPPFGKLAAKKAELEGQWRFCHNRLITNAEEVVFYGGQEIEKNQLWTCYTNLTNHLNYVYWRRSFYNMLEDFLMKYIWNASSLVMIALPVFSSTLPGQVSDSDDAVSTRTGDFITVRKLLLSSAKAVEKIMLVYKDIATLAGYTSRVYNMINVFEEVRAGRYQKKTIGGASKASNAQQASDEPSEGISTSGPTISPSDVAPPKSSPSPLGATTSPALASPNGPGPRENGGSPSDSESGDSETDAGYATYTDTDTDTDTSPSTTTKAFNKAFARAKVRAMKMGSRVPSTAQHPPLIGESATTSSTTSSTPIPATHLPPSPAPAPAAKTTETVEGSGKSPQSSTTPERLQIKGKIVDGENIKFDRIPIITPNGDMLIPSLSFEIKPGQHLLIKGPNGSGKSSVFRILGELWPVYDGVLTKPRARGSLFYLPQRAYLPMGNLRDQLIYPDSTERMKQVKKWKDMDLLKLLQLVSLEHLLEREGGWDAVQDWKDVLSGGEKQRIAMARLFYHLPKYAILDECTNAVSIDVEEKMYLEARQRGITLISITHRPSLKKFHDFILEFDGFGGYNFRALDDEQ